MPGRGWVVCRMIWSQCNLFRVPLTSRQARRGDVQVTDRGGSKENQRISWVVYTLYR